MLLGLLPQGFGYVALLEVTGYNVILLMPLSLAEHYHQLQQTQEMHGWVNSH